MADLHSNKNCYETSYLPVIPKIQQWLREMYCFTRKKIHGKESLSHASVAEVVILKLYTEGCESRYINYLRYIFLVYVYRFV